MRDFHISTFPNFQIFGVLGDIHGDFAAARAIVGRHPDVPFWLCVGDIADEHGRYESIGAPLYWIHGNNDNFDAIASGALPGDLHHIENGSLVEIWHMGEPVVQVAGLGGTFAPTWYETRAAELPHPTLRQAQGRPERSRRATHLSASGFPYAATLRICKRVYGRFASSPLWRALSTLHSQRPATKTSSGLPSRG